MLLQHPTTTWETTGFVSCAYSKVQPGTTARPGLCAQSWTTMRVSSAPTRRGDGYEYAGVAGYARLI